MLTAGQVQAWVSHLSPAQQAWITVHPDAGIILRCFGDQGFDACGAAMGIILPAQCLTARCGHSPERPAAQLPAGHWRHFKDETEGRWEPE